MDLAWAGVLYDNSQPTAPYPGTSSPFRQVTDRNRLIDCTEEPYPAALGVAVGRAAHAFACLMVCDVLRLTGDRRV